MSDPRDEGHSGVNTALAERIGRLREKYEAEWLVAEKGGPEPSLEFFLAQTPEPDRPLIQEALSQIDRAHRERRSTTGNTSIPDDMLPTMVGRPDGSNAPTVSPTAMLAIDRNSPTFAPTFADESGPTHGSTDETIAPTIAATRAGMSIASGLPVTVAMDASGVTVEHKVEPVASKKPKGPKEAPKVDGYEILGELGRGGMGVVYKARHKKLDRLVALKMVIAGAHASQDQLDRFITEAQAVARLQHPDIVQVYEVDEHEGLPYFSLEYVEGGTLAQKVGGQPQLPRYAAEITMILAGAMQVAHKKNIIHRDLKPANILLTAEGLPKITDFGLAKKLEDDSHQTRSGAIMGTPSYMAPEQAWGENDQIGPLADEYALGAILYEMLTGRPPFQGATPLDTLEQVRSKEPVPPAQLQPKIPKDLETVCLKALQKESHKRYASCEELANDLQRFLDGKPIQARPVSRTEKAWRWCRRNPGVAGLAAAMILLAVGTFTIAVYSAVTISLAYQKVAASEKVVIKQRDRAEASEKAAKTQEEIARNNAVRADEQSGVALRALYTLASDVNKKLRGQKDMQQLRLDLVLLAEQSIESVQINTSDRKRLAELYLLRAGAPQQLGLIYQEMGKPEEATKYTKLAEKYIDEMSALDPGDPFNQQRVAKVKNTLGDLHHYHLGNAELARSYYEQALKMRKEIAAAFPSDEQKIDVANNLGLVAMTTLKLGDPQGALKLFLEELDWRNQLSAEYVAMNTEARRELSGLYDKLGEVMIKVGEPLKAQDYYDKSFELRATLASDPATKDQVGARMDLASALNNFGHLNLMELADPKSARKYYERALLQNVALRVENPDSIQVAQNLSATYYYVATAALRMGDKDAADENYQKCLDLRRSLATNAKAKLLEIDLIVALARCGFHDEAAQRTDAVLKNPPQDNQIYFQAACGYALSAGAVAGDKPKDQWTKTEQELASAYTIKAVDALRHGIERGWKDLSSLQTDPDLDPVRQDPRFVALVDDVKRTQAASEKANR